MARRLLLFLTFSFLFINQAFAAMSGSIVYELRTTATANNVNGGGFRAGASGTDYSQQNAAQWTNTNLSTSAANATTVTSAGSTFTAAIVGNVMNITAGTNFTAGWYEVTAFTDANNVVLDRTPTPSAAGSAGTFYVGGAMSMNSTLDDDFFEALVAGNKVWIKNGSFIVGEAVSMAAAGGTQNPIVMEGYNATRGDGPTGTNRPTFSGGANAVTLGANVDVYNVIFTGTAATMFTSGSGAKLVNCKFMNTSSTVDRVAVLVALDNLAFNGEAVSYWGLAVQLWSSSTTLSTFYIHDSNVGVGHGFTTSDHVIESNIIADHVTAAIRYTGADTDFHFIRNNTLYGAENTIGIGVSLASGVTDVELIGNIIYGFATGVSHGAVQSVGFDNYNDYNNNDTDVTNWTKGANDSALAPTFTNVTQVTGTTGAFVEGGSKLVDTSKNFTTLGVAAGEIVYITGGTGSTTRKYLIDSISTTTNPNDTLNITVPASPGINTTADKTYQITLGHNFAIGTNLKALGFPGAFQGGLTTGYLDIGAVQRQEPAGGGSGYSRGRVVNQ